MVLTVAAILMTLFFLAGLHVNAALGHGSLVEWRYFDLEARLYGERFVPKGGTIGQ